MERCDSKINEHMFPFFLIKGNYFILSILSVTELRVPVSPLVIYVWRWNRPWTSSEKPGIFTGG